MRALKRVLAVGALTAPLMIGCAGLASANEGPEAHWGNTSFVADETGACFAQSFSVVSPNGVEHGSHLICADSTGVSGFFTDAGASW
ncbi:hypothetical protein ACFV4P_33280 [Kitasatospora sp. NPDC059795]|uniref:hypothetical protein n=1 Tax=Kitasatospora sp. NPDC059795 TaxID=3346949 RepID=UPI003652A13B